MDRRSALRLGIGLQRSDRATYRPMGLAVGPDGSLYVTESQQGRVWRVSYPG